MPYDVYAPSGSISQGRFRGTFQGKRYEESGAHPYDVTDGQKDFLIRNHVRYILAVLYESADAAAKWSNRIQEIAERQPHSIPVSFSSDPRNSASNGRTAAFSGSSAKLSGCLEGPGMAPLFDPDAVRDYARHISKEYLAPGITAALSP